MREKYFFFTLLIIALIMLLSTALGSKAKAKAGAELPIERKLKQAAQNLLARPKEISIDKIQDLVSFSRFEGMLKRNIFSEVQLPEPGQQAQGQALVLPVEEQTPLFIYKGKIGLGSRLMVIIEQTRSGEVFMASAGENINGYKVLEITDSEVVLSKEGEGPLTLNLLEKP